jgi:transposase
LSGRWCEASLVAGACPLSLMTDRSARECDFLPVDHGAGRGTAEDGSALLKNPVTGVWAGSLLANVWCGLLVLPGCRHAAVIEEELVDQMTLGIDVACRAAHQASLADAAGRLAWSGRRFRTAAADLERLWGLIPAGAAVTVVMEPTRNAWVPLAAWFRRHGATVIMVPPEQSADLRDYYSKHTKSDLGTRSAD